MSPKRPLGGTNHARFGPLRDAFADVVALHPGYGAALAVTLEGELVVNLWGGMAAAGTPWDQQTRCIMWSTTKGMAALCVQALADRGELDLDASVATYWPEFAQAGKESITVANVLTHTAGLPYWDGFERVVCTDRPATFRNLSAITTALAVAEPVVPPGGEIAYHAITYGWLLDEIVFRATGLRLGEQFAKLIAGPLNLGVRIGPNTPIERWPAPVGVINSPSEKAALLDAVPSLPYGGRVMLFCNEESRWTIDRVSNDPDFIQSGVGSAGGIGDARSLARAYGMLANGGVLDGMRHLSQASIDLFSACHARSYFPELGRYAEYGYGFQRATDPGDFGSLTAYGHSGLGGSMAFADPAAAIGFGFVMNSLRLGPDSLSRANRLAAALYTCI